MAGILFVGVLIVGYQFLPRILSRSVSQEVLRSKAKSPVSFQRKWVWGGGGGGESATRAVEILWQLEHDPCFQRVS